MPTPTEEPLTKVTLNLYTSDVEWFKQRYPENYTVAMRQAIRGVVIYRKDMED